MFSKASQLMKGLFPHSATNDGAKLTTFNCSGQDQPTEITVYRGTYNPTKCWEELSVKQTCKPVSPMPLDTPIYEDQVRFVCMSDTHNRTKHLLGGEVPMGDVFLHAGDFTMTGTPQQVEDFNNFLSSLPHTHKIVIAGNHELSFDPSLMSDRTVLGSMGHPAAYLEEKGLQRMSDILSNCTYLEDAQVTVAGIKIYGSPWQPEFGNWAFNLPRGQLCLNVWNRIPAEVDILMTHGPPVGHGDKVRHGARAGCVELLNTVQKRVKPKYHIFGHIHEDYGVTTDGHTTFINASTCNLRYLPVNPAVIFDLPLPEGVSKHDISAVVKACVNAEKPTDSNSEDESMDYIHFEESDTDIDETSAPDRKKNSEIGEKDALEEMDQ